MDFKFLKSINHTYLVILTWLCMLIFLTTHLKADYESFSYDDYQYEGKQVEVLIYHELPDMPVIGDLIMVPFSVSEYYTVYFECIYSEEEFDLLHLHKFWYEVIR